MRSSRAESRYCKSNRHLIIALFFFGLMISLFVGNAHCQTITGNAVTFYDGDTVNFRARSGRYYRVRLSGIDAPETRQTHGLVCKQLLKDALFAKTTTLNILGVDVYKRYIGFLSTPEIADVSLYMLVNGCAWEMSAPLSLKTIYQNAEQGARNEQVGLWNEQFPIPPWQFRSGIRPATYNPCNP